MTKTCVDKKFWFENPGALFSNVQVVPIGSLAEQMNAITRVVLIIGVIMWLFNFKYTLHFLFISLTFIIIIYYIQRRTMKAQENYSGVIEYYEPGVVEHYEPLLGSERPERPRTRSDLIQVQPYNMKNLAPTTTVMVDGQKIAKTIIPTSEILPFYNDAVSIDPPNPFAVGLNQSLAGNGAHPATKIKPVVVPPIYSLDYWKDNNLITFSQINTAGPQEDMYMSGYAESTCCDYLSPGTELVPNGNVKVNTVIGGGFRENFNGGCGPQDRLIPAQNRKMSSCTNSGGQIRSPVPVEDRPYIPTMQIRNPGVNVPFIRESYAPRNGCSNRTPASSCASSGIVSPRPVEDIPFIPVMRTSKPSMPVVGTPFVENYEYETVDNPRQVFVQPNQSGWVNTTCGYSADQVFEAGLPSNLPAGNCEQSPYLKQYNENLFTQTITPGVYTRNQVNEPINSNIGISFQQQFEPVSCKRDDKGLIYTQHDPRIIEPVEESDIPEGAVYDKANYDNVYDPRFYGYGTSYRSYNEPVTNQTRFFYDDINAVRMPTYITRSKIDHLPYADTYQSPPDGAENGNIHNPHIRALAQDSWLRDSLAFRNDLTERQMRKINSEAWQKRQFPNSLRLV